MQLETGQKVTFKVWFVQVWVMVRSEFWNPHGIQVEFGWALGNLADVHGYVYLVQIWFINTSI